MTIERLEKRVQDLELKLARAEKNSSNSSKSPSSDIVKPPARKRDRRKKTKRGGQPGHQRKLREPLPEDRIDESVTYELR
ncbi:MAG: IS66 family transposase, partial [Proteobacteria bacterium]|nr:IS66 family transposase [Pseudomonadota bacterium]